MNVGFLVQLTDGCGRDLAAPQRLRNILHPAHGDARQVHFDERFLHAAADQFLDLPLDNFLVQLYNFLGHSLLSPFRMVCRDFILPEPASYVFFYPFFDLRKLLYIIRSHRNMIEKSQKTVEVVCRVPAVSTSYFSIIVFEINWNIE